MTIAEDLFRAALHMTAPWYVSSLKFKEGEKRLDIWIDFHKGSRFQCPECNHLDCEGHDTFKKTWRHLNFFEHETYIHGRIPRIICPHCGVKLANIPWARPQSGFTLIMEAMIVLLAQTMQISQISEKLNINDKRIWRVIAYHVSKALQGADFSDVSSVGVDETSIRKGHQYITIFADIESGRIIYICKGKDSSTLSSFSQALDGHNSSVDNIEDFCCDMSSAFIKGISDNFPLASITFDKFHVMKLINEAVDEIRRLEQMLNRALKNTRYIWLKNPSNLTNKQLEYLGSLKDMNLKTVRAYNIKLSFQMLWSMEDRQSAQAYFKKWYFWATHSKLPAMIKIAKTLKKHWNGIISYFDKKYSNGLLEGLNSLIQSLKVNARGYRNEENFMLMIYLRLGQLKFNLPT